MKFYQSISENYHHIFPLNKKHIEFVKTNSSNTKLKSLLDIGCGIGQLSFELSKLFKDVTAIDLDKAMIDKAKKNHHKDNLFFEELNMLHIEENYGVNKFHTIISFGNTIVHLDSLSSIGNFFGQCEHILKENGKLIFQIINYDRILDEDIKGLSDIDNDFIRFERKYNFNDKTKLIEFKTRLILKKTNEIIENQISLYPLRRNEIEYLLKEAGFQNIDYYGNFMGSDYKKSSIPLIVIASK